MIALVFRHLPNFGCRGDFPFSPLDRAEDELLTAEGVGLGFRFLNWKIEPRNVSRCCQLLIQDTFLVTIQLNIWNQYGAVLSGITIVSHC